MTAPVELNLMGLDCDRFSRSDAKTFRGPCPKCGGHRRLLVWADHPFPKWRVECNGCGFAAWADQLNPLLKHEFTAEERRQYAEREAEKARVAAEERRRRLAAFSDSEIAAEYHERMTIAHRQLWLDVGVPQEWQDYYALGYVEKRTFAHDGATFVSDAMTIPVYEFNRVPVNMQYRLLTPPPKVGKYRQEPGLPSAAFLSDPDRETFTDQVVVVEGAKKAMVLFIYGSQKAMVIGLPGARSWAGMVERLQPCGRVYVMLDPDAAAPAADLCRAIGKNARLVTVPDKADDLLLRHGATYSDLQRAMQYGTIP